MCKHITTKVWIPTESLISSPCHMNVVSIVGKVIRAANLQAKYLIPTEPSGTEPKAPCNLFNGIVSVKSSKSVDSVTAS